MSIIDDPVLALIARFVVDDLENLGITDEAFLKSQVETIRSHVGDVPEEEQQQSVLGWITEHAESYRQNWLRNALSRNVTNRRCRDCPLLHGSGTAGKGFCAIHSKWVILLHEYIDNKIDSEQYVAETLHILNLHKNDLKVSEILH